MSSAYPRMAASGVSQFVAHVGHELVLVLAGDLEIVDGLCKLARPCLHLFEKARVLDRNHSLIGEGGHELDLLVTKGLYYSAHQHNDADLVAATEQRHTEQAAELTSALRFAESILGICEHIRDLNGLAFLQNAPDEAASSGMMPVGAFAIFGVVGWQAVACQLDVYVAFSPPDRGHVASA